MEGGGKTKARSCGIDEKWEVCKRSGLDGNFLVRTNWVVLNTKCFGTNG